MSHSHSHAQVIKRGALPLMVSEAADFFDHFRGITHEGHIQRVIVEPCAEGKESGDVDCKSAVMPSAMANRSGLPGTLLQVQHRSQCHLSAIRTANTASATCAALAQHSRSTPCKHIAHGTHTARHMYSTHTARHTKSTPPTHTHTAHAQHTAHTHSTPPTHTAHGRTGPSLRQSTSSECTTTPS